MRGMEKTTRRDVGLLIIRLGIGTSMLVLHGWGKITGGPERWERLGGTMRNFGIDFAPAFWGFMAGFAETFGSLALILGIAFLPGAALLAFTMFVASVRHLMLPPGDPGAGWSGASHALELMCIYIALIFTGPGRFVVPLRLGRRKKR
ncbi:MAG: DoxX family protein [Acidobacteria bacterium]|nr:MAG: DoxX family protein [Acidobacteriota bacterium]REK05590.1 MAG: DoxX family protein [Acidobacteriota bacterium]